MKQKKQSFIRKFLQMESSGGIILMISAILAIISANTSLSYFYEIFLSTPVHFRISDLIIAKPLLLWINDGLMAIFFFLVGLELKREFLEGELSDKSNIVLPAIGALGGIVAPALIYYAFNYSDPITAKGWAIPAATDIAFALGVLALLGSRVPTSIKIFLTSLAIFDDLGAIIIIALFYTSKISITPLLFAAICIPALVLLNKKNVVSNSPYILIGIIMWVALLKSGVHATLSGVIMALFIPMRSKKDPHVSPLKEIEHDLHAIVAYAILPTFAFANAGIDFRDIDIGYITHSVPLGIAAGLFLGKPIGIFFSCWAFIKMGIIRYPKGMDTFILLGTATLCGVGFTMSLFIGSLTFEVTDSPMFFDERLGIVIGSLLSGSLGYFLLRYSLNKKTV